MARPKKPRSTRAARKRRPDLPADSRKVYNLRLYITGRTPHSTRSLRNLRDICEEHLSGRFILEVVDIYQQPELAREAQILAAPTLVKELPPPIRRLVGDLSDRKQVLLRLGIESQDSNRGTKLRE
ncbi:MAG TPA: circadian clock KaiB family protein [Candidatus Acidoferrales bacterium]|nr:circadian clock KaiB family protein [Candidatus Acidoferrales bacterium]